ncbi:DUF397 domain-containing protein [Micromonospora sp. WMMD1082]|uniref:DUF397 domain-containing protein n=1 Tax=Micromonospora sp. WMMD1082 TaxID=3016104 RepID=UPI00241705F2|nr:DUF397 domain-containing protein [Micromonospora sp. WMMD1082]MDG4794505.1 DUF397 domain-containing protein [Micromonospora sp. WMMD1082]
MSDRDWFTSSRSSDNAACVEVRCAGGAVGVRDSKDRSGPALAFAATPWTTFLHTLKANPATPL